MNSFIKKEFKSQIGYIICNILLNILLTLILLSLPLIQGNLVDVFVYSRNMSKFYFWILTMVILTVVQIIIRFFLTKIDMLKKEKFVLSLNLKFLDYIFESNTKKVLEYDLTYLHSSLLHDSASVIHFLFNTTSMFISNIILMFVASFILFRVNSLLLISLVVFLPIYTIIYFIFKEKIYLLTKRLLKASNDCFSARNNIYINYIDIKARKREAEVKKRLKKQEDILMEGIGESFVLNYFLSTIKIGTNSIFQFLGFIIGGLAVLNGYITLGVFTYIIQYFSMLLNTVEEFLNIGESYEKYRASLTRLNEILDIDKDMEGKIHIESVEHIEIKDLNYKHYDHLNYLFNKEISFKLSKNNLYILEGENGVGKSTLFMLITGMYKDKGIKGEILINGLPLGNIDMNHFRRECVSIMLQQSFDIGTTVREFLSSFISENNLQNLLNLNIYKDIFVSNQFNLNDVMDKEFDVLSGGEKQLINLLVCVSKNASFYILDEPISNIFPDLRGKIINLLQEMANSGKVVLVSSHDRELISKGISYVLK